MATVNVSVDVELDDFDESDLVDELQSRGFKVEGKNLFLGDNDEPPEALKNMFMALSFGDEKKALDLLRTYLCDCLGRVL